MRSKSFIAATAMTLMMPALAFAGSKNSTNIQLQQPVMVAGTQLAPGPYKVIWGGTGPDVTVSFTEGKKTVATALAKLVSKHNDPQGIETNSAAGSPATLHAIELKELTIRFENTATSAGD